MNKYIVLLRGINVGGKNIIPMPQLKKAFEDAGFLEVSTYINNGNVICSSEENNAERLQKKCREIIRERFDMDIVTAVITAEDLADALNAAPEWWGDDKESKHNAIFVIAPTTADAVLGAVGEAKPEYEKVACVGQVIFWSAPLSTFSRTRWSKIVSIKELYNSITIRNANTARKLHQLTRF